MTDAAHEAAGAFRVRIGSSGEDSFVAVVVTKLTGALLFILLLTMVIMALLPKVMELPAPTSAGESEETLAIQTPDVLPEAIAGHPYAVALAATGGHSALRWAVDGEIPPGLEFDPSTAQLRGTPKAGTSKPVSLILRVSDGSERASKTAELVVYESDRPLTTPSRWKPGLPPVPWRAWLEQGFGFLILALIHAVGMNAVAGAQRWSLARVDDGPDAAADIQGLRRRFLLYRTIVRLASLTATAALAFWLWKQQG